MIPVHEEDIKVYNKTKTKLPLNTEPISVTVLKIGKHFVVDPINEEEDCTDTRLTVATAEDGTIHAMQKGEVGLLTVEDIKQMVKISKDKSKELRKLL